MGLPSIQSSPETVIIGPFFSSYVILSSFTDDNAREFGLKDDLVAQLEQISTLTGRSRNEVISMLLEYAVENCEISE
jgi:hypothetical protein